MLRNPYDACYGIKRENRTSWLSAIIVLASFFVLHVANKYFAGFLFKMMPDGYYELLNDFLVVFGAFLLLTICCYLVCTITDGEARFKDIFISDITEQYISIVQNAPAFDMEVCKAIDEALQAIICKNLFLCNRQKTKFYLLMIPGDKVFKTKELSHQIGSSRLSFADPEDMEKYLDITPGSMSLMGLMNDPDNNVRLLVDEDVLKDEWLGCHPCINTSSMRLRTADAFGKFLAMLRLATFKSFSYKDGDFLIRAWDKSTIKWGI